MDFEDGPTLSSLLILNIEVGRLCMMKQKSLVDGMTVAIASIFDNKVLATYKRETDAALSRTDILQPAESNGASDPKKSKDREMRHTVSELNKLNHLLTGG